MPVLRAALALALLASAPDPARIEKLVAQLGSERWADREAAADELLRVGQPAVPALERALKSADREARHRARLLLDRLRWQPPEGISETLRAAMEHYTVLPEPQRSALLARVASETGDDAAIFLRQALRHDRSDAVRAEALSHLTRLDMKAAEVELRALAADKLLARWAWEQLGHMLYRRGDSAGALAAYESARAAGSREARVTATLARLYKSERHWTKARDLFSELLAADADNLDHRRELGQCHYMLGDEAAAEAAWRKMLGGEKDGPRAYLWLAQAYHGIGARDKQLDVLREGARKHPADYELLRELARGLTRERRYAEAVGALERALEAVGPDYQRQSVTVELTRVLRLGGQLRAHLERREAALQALDHDIVALLRRLADRHLAAGNRPAVRAALERLIALYPDSDAARQARQRLGQLGDPDKP